MITIRKKYDCFKEEMNRKNSAGYQKILTMTFPLASNFVDKPKISEVGNKKTLVKRKS